MDGSRGQAIVFALAMTLAALAGFVDATGYIHFHHLFTSFMSGNSTQAMVAGATWDVPKLATLGRTILLFVAGVTLGEMLAATSPRWGRPVVLLLEALLLAAALAAVSLRLDESWTASFVALAMGVQNAAVHKAEGISVALTYVTGTLVHVGRGLAAALCGKGTLFAVLPFVGLWVALALGGFLGAVVATQSLTAALATATGACLALIVWSGLAALVRRDAKPG